MLIAYFLICLCLHIHLHISYHAYMDIWDSTSRPDFAGKVGANE